ncbi:hypothetical protein MKW98_025023, partial [Papaver atlanticum]
MSRVISVSINGSVSWNKVARAITQKLKWNRYLKLITSGEKSTIFYPISNIEWMQTWQPIKWIVNDTTIE